MIRALVLAALFGFATVPAALAQSQETASDAFDFGDDAGSYALNGTCEDPRFEGAGMTAADDAMLHDAKDCITLFANGKIDISEQGRSLHPEGPLDILDILTKISKGGGKVTDIN